LNPDELEEFLEQHQAQEAAGPAEGETREQEIERTYNEDMAKIDQNFDEELAAIQKEFISNVISAVEWSVKSKDVRARKTDAMRARTIRNFNERIEEREKSHGL
jgi:UDP:flavonoid glycosyltransferase YjiC (YdhE family)